MPNTNGASRQEFKLKAAVCDVDVERYVGTWYEIARFNHIFERNLDHVTATYSLLTPSKIRVINRGIKNGKMKKAQGRAYIQDEKCLGNLLVSFFPFVKSLYRIIKLEENYQYAIVTSGEHYLWILARTPIMEDKLYQSLLDYLSDCGYDVGQLIKVKQS